MNLILLDSAEPLGIFNPADRRYQHIRTILRASAGSVLKGGVLNGPIGILEILSLSSKGIEYRFIPKEKAPQPYPLGVLLGAMRPIVARRLLKDLTALGVDKISIVGADFSEPSYLKSNLWKKGEYQRSLEQGAEQGGTTILPTVEIFSTLKDFLQDFPKRQIQLVLDPEGNTSLLKVYNVLKPMFSSPSAWIAIGPERGWSKSELNMFEEAGFLPCRMGKRVLRTEAAALIATGIIVAQWDTEQVY